MIRKVFKRLALSWRCRRELRGQVSEIDHEGWFRVIIGDDVGEKFLLLSDGEKVSVVCVVNPDSVIIVGRRKTRAKAVDHG